MAGKTTIAKDLQKTRVFLGKDGKPVEKPKAKQQQEKRKIKSFQGNLRQI